MTAHEGVNEEKSREIGGRILAGMAGKSVEEYVFRKVHQAVKGQPPYVDPQLLFQRLITVRERYEDVTMQLPPSFLAA